MDDMLRDLAYEVQEAVTGVQDKMRAPMLWNAEDVEVDTLGASPAVIVTLEDGRKVRLVIESE